MASSLGTGGRYDPAADTWSLTSMTNAPTNRYGHTAVWTGSEMIVFGGIGTSTRVAKRYRPATDTWTDATIVDAPGQRDHHAAVWTGTEMIVWGGFINDGITPTGGRYNPATNTWTPTNVGGSPVDPHVADRRLDRTGDDRLGRLRLARSSRTWATGRATTRSPTAGP